MTKVSSKLILAALVASLAILASCTKTIEIVNEKNSNPTESTVEITLNTIASPTKAIAEGTEVPIDNEIRFFPRFFSDIYSVDYSDYNDIYMFGYDTERKVWRNYINSVFPSGDPFDYNFSPLCWPAGERVFMDYVACSFSNYVYFQNREENSVLTVEPVKKNTNRMDVNYAYSYLTRPFASGMLLEVSALKEMRNQVRAMYTMGYLEESEVLSLSDIDLDKYAEAADIAMDKIALDDAYFASDHYLTGASPEEIKADAANQLNLAYWFFMNYAPRIYRFMQDDLLYAHDGSLKDSNHGEVKAVFNHSKAWVKVIVNNQTANDLFISGIRFDNVKSDGTLVIDNSKSAFEAYWDFPETENVTTAGATIGAYNEASLDGSLERKKKAKNAKMKGTNEIATKAAIDGMIPDQYIIPQGCYGPALAVGKAAKEGGLIEALNCTFLNGKKSFNTGDENCRAMIARLGGMMFPAQTPGVITIGYTFWKPFLRPTPKRRGESEDISSYTLPMNRAVGMFNTFLPSDSREISFNLPRQDWKMGKVYVYVLTIAENEITINPYVTEWEEKDIIFYPGGDEKPSSDGSGSTPTFGNNYQNPGWWK